MRIAHVWSINNVNDSALYAAWLFWRKKIQILMKTYVPTYVTKYANIGDYKLNIKNHLITQLIY